MNNELELTSNERKFFIALNTKNYWIFSFLYFSFIFFLIYCGIDNHFINTSEWIRFIGKSVLFSITIIFPISLAYKYTKILSKLSSIEQNKININLQKIIDNEMENATSFTEIQKKVFELQEKQFEIISQFNTVNTQLELVYKEIKSNCNKGENSK
ncbi:hypothetical protein GKC56_03185 [Neisseriaceae bacterium PsAf]|nr:hypothetical protein [Neisseriaceae bacterium PsAf]MCV2502481.1 hypothetical protein [Neisseriaceae bacterium]